MGHNHVIVGDSISTDPGTILKAHQRHRYDGRFFMCYDYALNKIRLEAPEILPTVIDLITRVDYDNLVIFRPSALAHEVPTSQITIERHFKRALEIHLLEKDPKEKWRERGISNWRICPYLVWRGTRDQRDAYLRNLPKDHPWLTEWKEPQPTVK